MDSEENNVRRVVGGVDTHKDLHVAAVVADRDRVLATQCFATTRQGYRQMLAWMRSFGELERIGVNRQLWRWSATLCATGGYSGSGGDNAGQAGPKTAWQE